MAHDSWLERAAESGECFRVAPPILVSRNLVVNKRVGLALHHFQHAGILLVQHQHPRLFDGVHGDNVPGRSFLDRHDPPRLVGVRHRLDRRFFPTNRQSPVVKYPVGKGNRLRPLLRRRHRGNDQVDLVRLQRRNQPVERNVLDFDLAPEEVSQIARQIDADPGGLSALVGHLERRIGQFHADDQLRVRFGGARRKDGEAKATK